MTIVIRADFHEKNKHYPQYSLDECLEEILKCYFIVKLTLSVRYSFRFQTNDCNRCYDLLMMSVNQTSSTISSKNECI